MLNMIRSVALLLMVALVAGCSDSTGPGDGSVTGTFKLQTVNGNNLPAAVIQIGNDKVEITEGSITMNADKTYSSRIGIRVTEGGRTITNTEASTGTYARNNNAITFTDSDGEVNTGSLSGGNTITFTDEGFVLVFKK